MDAGDLTLRAALVPLTTLSFGNLDLAAIRAILAQKQADAPALFNNLPCVIDLAGLDPAVMALADLHALCLDCGLLPIAVRNVSEPWAPQLGPLRLADLGKGNNRRAVAAEPQAGEGGQAVAAAPAVPDAAPTRALRVHTGNVRSGQQLHFDGDLVIQGMVSPGAEVLATGDVHVYGVLRGRVLAGVKGDETAVIGCQQFDGELVAIAGHYRTFDTDHPHRDQGVVIRLDDGSLNISTLS